MVERQNYLKVKLFLKYMEEVQQVSKSSLDRYSFYLRHLLLWANEHSLGESPAIRPTLQAYATSVPGKDGETTLAFETQKKIIEISKRFFIWAKATYPKEFTKVTLTWIETLRPPRTPQIGGDPVYVSEDEINRLTSIAIPKDDLCLLRDRAAAARLYLTGERISAFATSPILALDLRDRCVRQWPELGVHTKFGKRATTFLLPIPKLIDIVSEWDDVVRANLPHNYPWYAPIEQRWGDQRFSKEPPGKNRHQALEKRLKLLYTLSGLPYKSAHKFRHGHAVFGLMHAQTMADYKAISVNLMHDSLTVTDEIYARIMENDVKNRIQGLVTNPVLCPDNELQMMIYKLSPQQLPLALTYIATRLSQ
jgi:integrase